MHSAPATTTGRSSMCSFNQNSLWQLMDELKQMYLIVLEKAYNLVKYDAGPHLW